jgi:hypothetical protein
MALVGSLTRLPPPVHWLSLQVDTDEATVVELLRGNIESKAVPKGAVDIGATEGGHVMSHLREAWHRPQWYSPAWWAAYVTGKAPVFRRALWEALKPWDATPELLLAAIEKATLAFEAAVAAVVAAGGRASDVLPGGGHIALRHGPRAMRKWWGANELRLLDLCGWMAPLAALVLSATPATPAAVELAVLASGRCLQSTRVKCGQADWYRTDDASSYNCVWITLLSVCLGHPPDPSRGSGTLTRTCPPIFYESIVSQQMRTPKNNAYFWPPTTEGRRKKTRPRRVYLREARTIVSLFGPSPRTLEGPRNANSHLPTDFL